MNICERLQIWFIKRSIKRYNRRKTLMAKAQRELSEEEYYELKEKERGLKEKVRFKLCC